jgi:hypothetical protein
MTAEPSKWRDLLELALPVLDHVFNRSVSLDDPDWTLGGGTAIAIQLNHRVSYDIDIFLQRGKLKALTPSENPAARLISDRYQWPGHYLKYERPEGEIDFLSAVLQTEPGFEPFDFNGRIIAIETPEEVIVKKVRYRSERFTPRDVFDLAAVATGRTGLAKVLADEVPDALGRLTESLRLIEARGLEVVEKGIIPTQFGSRIMGDSFEIANSTVAQAVDILTERTQEN